MTVQNLLFFAHTLCMNYVTNTLLLVRSSVRSIFARSWPKSEQKPTTKNFFGFHNHSPLLTMVPSETWIAYANEANSVNKDSPIVVIHQTFSLTRYWSNYITWVNMPQLNLGNVRLIFPNFQTCLRCEDYLNDNKHKSLHLGRNYA